MVKIESLKKGDLFKLKPEGKSIYVFDGYCRFNKKYMYTRYDDICASSGKKKGTMVCEDF